MGLGLWSAGDLITTYIVMVNGGIETNIFFRNLGLESFLLMVVLKIIGAIIIFGCMIGLKIIVNWLEEGTLKKSLKLFYWIPLVMIIFLGIYPVIWNIRTILELLG